MEEAVVYSFASGADGAVPQASLIDVKGALYGTTSEGGSSGCGGVGCGTVFSVDPKTGVETVVYSFLGDADGASPTARLIDVNGTLYGTTLGGGAHGGGTVFSINIQTGAETTVYSFCSQQNCTDGGAPYGGLIDVKGTLYGTTLGGGAHGGGTVFSVNPKTSSQTVVYSFPDGANPEAGLIDVKGTLYGTTSGLGTGYGKVFSVDPKTGVETVVYSFLGGADGAQPAASLIKVNGTLYGTTQAGGSGAGGTVFSVNPKTGVEKVVYSFCSQERCADGAQPEASLIDVNGTLYGTTVRGGCGTEGCGTVFSVNPKTGAETVVYSFCSQQNCGDGLAPWAGLIDVKGTLYGTTGGGGIYGDGTVFALKTP